MKPPGECFHDAGMGCLCCGAAVEVGVLCRPCAQDVAPCDGLIPDHVRSTVDTTDAAAWVVDGFGAAHAVLPKTGIGRHNDGELIVLASSVSREHAELRKTDAGWVVRDLGSRNGTFVDGGRAQGRAQLAARTVIKIGDVALWFLADVVHEPTAAPSMPTASAGGGLVRYNITPGATELCLVGTTDLAAGGALLSRTAGGEAWNERGLAAARVSAAPRALSARDRRSKLALDGARLCPDAPTRARSPVPVEVRQRGERPAGRAAAAHRARGARRRRPARCRAGTRLLPRRPRHRRFVRSTMIFCVVVMSGSRRGRGGSWRRRNTASSPTAATTTARTISTTSSMLVV